MIKLGRLICKVKAAQDSFVEVDHVEGLSNDLPRTWS
jgi:hypothetical protein